MHAQLNAADECHLCRPCTPAVTLQSHLLCLTVTACHACVAQALQNNFDDLPEDDEEDIDFVLDDLLDSDWEEGSPTPQRRIHHPPRGAAKMGLHTAAEAGTPRSASRPLCKLTSTKQHQATVTSIVTCYLMQ